MQYMHAVNLNLQSGFFFFFFFFSNFIDPASKIIVIREKNMMKLLILIRAYIKFSTRRLNTKVKAI